MSELLYLLLGVLLGASANHHLAKRREIEKERRARDEAAATARRSLEAAWHLTSEERDILRECAAPDGFPKGKVWIMSIDAIGSWVRAGKHDFQEDHDPSYQARYMDAFQSLLRRGLVRPEGGTLFQLTGAGFDRAKECRGR